MSCGEATAAHEVDLENERKTELDASNSNQTRANSHVEDVLIVDDAVFGHVGDKGPNYRSLSKIGTIALMTKTQVGLGVLAIPRTFHVLGLIPGVFCLVGISVMTAWSNYMVGSFKLNHPEVYTIDDAGFKMFGKIGREIFAVIFMLNWVFISASAMLGISVGFNAVSTHALCTALFVFFAAIITFFLASIRTLSKIGWIAWVGIVCIMTSVFSVTIAVAVDGKNSAARQREFAFQLTNNPHFSEAMAAISSQIFAYAGTPAYFSIVAEMRDPNLYTSALIWSQSIITTVYVVIGVVMYCYVGGNIASPALASAGVVMKKVGFGFALPGLFVSAMIVTHVPAKYIFLRILRGSEHLHKNSLIHWGTWLGCTSGITVIAYIIASAIPSFDPLVSLVGASFGVFLCFQPFGCMWLYDNWGCKKRSLKWRGKFAWAIFVIVIGTFLMIGGTYGSIIALKEAGKVKAGRPWACEDNSNSV
ncbi:neutral amino acid permease [Fusarium beomiforme]|uniref:Neutral amino acid permease n=1 Tax=Fusarium beomiforme TaxID=44412 RepID=A0A9P5DZE4_9HYPO|nr:neutral amino acid permease [Fusarium beomiforme]